MKSDETNEAPAEAVDDSRLEQTEEEGPWRIGSSPGPRRQVDEGQTKSPEPRSANKQDASGEISEEADDLQDGFTHEGRIDEFEQDDPLAPAYDLERGAPLSHGSPLEGLPHRAQIRSTKEFFATEILYRYDILTDAEREALRGTYRIDLRGAQGGVWTVEITDSLNVLNRREEAEIVISMQQRDFLPLLNGQLNPQLAIFAQKLRITGDLHKGILFQSLLTPQSD